MWKKVAAGLNFPVKLGNSRGPTLKFSNAAVITCNHSDIHQRTSSSLNHHLNNLSCSDRLRKKKKKKGKTSTRRHLRTAGRKCQPRGKLNLIAICSYKENQGRFKCRLTGNAHEKVSSLRLFSHQRSLQRSCFSFCPQMQRMTPPLEEHFGGLNSKDEQCFLLCYSF